MLKELGGVMNLVFLQGKMTSKTIGTKCTSTCWTLEKEIIVRKCCNVYDAQATHCCHSVKRKREKKEKKRRAHTHEFVVRIRQENKDETSKVLSLYISR